MFFLAPVYDPSQASSEASIDQNIGMYIGGLLGSDLKRAPRAEVVPQRRALVGQAGRDAAVSRAFDVTSTVGTVPICYVPLGFFFTLINNLLKE